MPKKYNYTKKTGRPTDYSPEVLKILEEYIKEAVPENMEIATVEGLAIKIGVVVKTIYNWAKEHEEFLQALEHLKEIQKQQLIKTGIFGGKEVNATIIALLLKVNHDMVETEKKLLGNINDKELKIEVIDYKPKEDKDNGST